MCEFLHTIKINISLLLNYGPTNILDDIDTDIDTDTFSRYDIYNIGRYIGYQNFCSLVLISASKIPCRFYPNEDFIMVQKLKGQVCFFLHIEPYGCLFVSWSS